MEEKVNKLEVDLQTVKESAFNIKGIAKKANEKLKQSIAENQKKVAERELKVKERKAKAKQEVKEKKEKLQKSIDAYLVENNATATAAQRKAEDAEAYASACINHAFEVVKEAQLAVQGAILAEEHAMQMK